MRAYATNSSGTAYGNQEIFTTLTIFLPTISTTAISGITYTSAVSGGYISSDGGGAVFERGICWSTSQNPIITNSHTSDGTGIGTFSSSMNNLLPGTTYYVRAYATNSTGTAYGIQQSFTTNIVLLPILTTNSITDITPISALSGGNITSDGGSPITDRGICWSTTQNPVFTNPHTSDGTGSGTYVSNLYGLSPGTVYYVRAFATNSAGLAYGNQQIFTTTTILLPTLTTSAISSITTNTAIGGGNILSDGGGVITARGICWSTSINPTTADPHTTDGTGLGSFTSNLTGLNHNTIYYVCAYATNSMGTVYGNQQIFTTNPIYLPIISTIPTSDITSNSALSGGNITSDGSSAISSRGVCWSTSPNPLISGNHTNDGNGIGAYTSNITGLLSGTTYYVRAYATNIIGTAYGNQLNFTTNSSSLPTITTSSISNISSNSATSGGNITNDGGSNIITRGICWSITPNPSIYNSTISNGIGIGSFTIIMYGLSANTTYYVKAYATNGIGPSYGNEISFTTTQSGGLGSTVTDIDGNVYDTVTIGTQIWMKQNLNVTRFNNGDSIPQITDVAQWTNLDSNAYCFINNNANNGPIYGRLYNFYTVNDSRNVCPVDWHIPTDAEWTILENQLGGMSVAGGKMKEIGLTHWNSPNSYATNSSNFTALPGGKRGSDGTFTIIGNSSYWWSSTTSSISSGIYRRLDYNQESVIESTHSFKNGLSIRCLKN